MKRSVFSKANKKDSEDGQAIVEFALVLPLLLLLLCGLIDFGWLFANQYKVDNAAYEAARFASINAAQNTPSQLFDATREEALDSLGGDANDPQVALDMDGGRLSVTVSCKIKTITFVASTLFGEYYNAESTSVSVY